jgi:hypothetical protein
MSKDELHLAIPIPFSSGQRDYGRIIVFKISDGETIGCTLDTSKKNLEHEIRMAGWTHYIQCPELPKPDRDEQEFDLWWEPMRYDYTEGAKAQFKQGWMAARGKK